MSPFYTKSIDELSQMMKSFDGQETVKSVLMLMADKNHFTDHQLDPLLQAMKKPVIGGVFPEIIVDGQRKKEGIILIPQHFSLKTQLIDFNGIVDKSAEFLRLFEGGFPLQDINHGQLFLFIDALGCYKIEFIDFLFNYFGLSVSYLGAGAGSLSFEPFKCVIHNSGLHQNAVVVGLADLDVTIGYAHGWKAITSPMKVTESNFNRIISINWQPAFEVYKQAIAAHSGKIIDRENFFETAKSYPLGMVKLDDELIIRDPYKVIDNTIYLVDNVFEGEYISIMHGDTQSLLTAARKAENEVRSHEGNPGEKQYLAIDCISRVLFLQDDFDQELAIIRRNHSINGALTIGEIANTGSTFLGIFNKTVVLASWENLI